MRRPVSPPARHSSPEHRPTLPGRLDRDRRHLHRRPRRARRLRRQVPSDRAARPRPRPDIHEVHARRSDLHGGPARPDGASKNQRMARKASPTSACNCSSPAPPRAPTPIPATAAMRNPANTSGSNSGATSCWACGSRSLRTTASLNVRPAIAWIRDRSVQLSPNFQRPGKAYGLPRSRAPSWPECRRSHAVGFGARQNERRSPHLE